MARVLFAEDNELVRLVITAELAEAGFDVIEAANGDEGLTILQREPAFDLLLTDIQMPGSADGWDLAEAARTRDPHIAVVYLSGYSAVASRPVAASAFIGKPCRSDILLATIRSLLLGRAAP